LGLSHTYIYIYAIYNGPVNIAKLCGVKHENHIRLEKESDHLIKILIPRHGTADNDAQMITVKGPKTLVTQWCERLASEYKPSSEYGRPDKRRYGWGTGY